MKKENHRQAKVRYRQQKRINNNKLILIWLTKRKI